MYIARFATVFEDKYIFLVFNSRGEVCLYVENTGILQTLEITNYTNG